MAIAFSLMLGTCVYAAESAEADKPALDIAYANLEFGNKVYLYIAVDYSDFDSAEGITLKITNNKTGTSATYIPNQQIIAPKDCVAFRCTMLGPRNMGDELTLQAYKDGVANGEAKTYSILEYALRAETYGDQKLTDLMKGMIKLGADYQKAYKHEGTYDLAKSWGLVLAPNSTLKKAIVEAGSVLTLISAEAGKSLLCTSDLVRLEGTSVTVEAGCRSYIFVDESELAE